SYAKSDNNNYESGKQRSPRSRRTASEPIFDNERQVDRKQSNHQLYSSKYLHPDQPSPHSSKNLRTSPEPSSKNEIRCCKCSQPGHFTSECPQRNDQSQPNSQFPQFQHQSQQPPFDQRQSKTLDSSINNDILYYKLDSSANLNKLDVSLEINSNYEQPNNEYLISNRAILDKKESYEDMNIDADVFSGVQFSKPIIRSNNDFTAISKFVSIDSTFSPGMSAAAHVEVDRLLSLLEGKKAKIDHILESQHVYAVGIDFQKDLFENEFEIIEKILTPTDTDVNNSNSTPPSGDEKESKEKENDDNCSGNDEKNGDGTSEKENGSEDDEDGSGDSGGENNKNDNKDNGKEINDNNSNDDGNGGDGNGSIISDFKNIIVTSASRVITKE
ncbi:15709_t:CDS:2, partial [Racocetra fulgida]